MLLALVILFFLLGGGHLIFMLLAGALFHPVHMLTEVAIIGVSVYLARKLIDRYVPAKPE